MLLGATIQQNNNNGSGVQGFGYSSDLALMDITSAASVSPMFSLANVYKYAALFTRLNYNWKNKYIVNLTARRMAVAALARSDN